MYGNRGPGVAETLISIDPAFPKVGELCRQFLEISVSVDTFHEETLLARKWGPLGCFFCTRLMDKYVFCVCGPAATAGAGPWGMGKGRGLGYLFTSIQ